MKYNLQIPKWYIKQIKSYLKRGDTVGIHGFGIFEVRRCKGKTIKNFQGKTVTFKPYKKISFVQGKVLKRFINR